MITNVRMLLATATLCCLASIGECAEYTNAWVKYADDKSTAYSIDVNSIMRNGAGNYYVFVMMTPYKDNVFNKRLKRTDIAYVYAENEIDTVKSRIRTLAMHAFDKKGNEVLTDTYAHTGEVPPFEDIVEGSVADSLRKYVIQHLKTNGQNRGSP